MAGKAFVIILKLFKFDSEMTNWLKAIAQTSMINEPLVSGV